MGSLCCFIHLVECNGCAAAVTVALRGRRSGALCTPEGGSRLSFCRCGAAFNFALLLYVGGG